MFSCMKKHGNQNPPNSWSDSYLLFFHENRLIEWPKGHKFTILLMESPSKTVTNKWSLPFIVWDFVPT